MSLRDLLIADEGLRLKPYRCTEGKLSVGVGRNLDDVGITREEAMMLLDHDITRATNAAAEVVGRDVFGSLNPARQAALVSMAFQMGRAGLEGFNRMLLCIRAGDWQGAQDNALDSKWARQTPARAERIARMILTGEW
jgi:lysozyme